MQAATAPQPNASGGRRAPQSVSRSYAEAARSRAASFQAPATICSPIGRPSGLNPAGIEIAGRPVRLNGCGEARQSARLLDGIIALDEWSGDGGSGQQQYVVVPEEPPRRCFISAWVRRAKTYSVDVVSRPVSNRWRTSSTKPIRVVGEPLTMIGGTVSSAS